MKILSINASTGTSKIFIGEKIENTHQYLPRENIAIITDKNLIFDAIIKDKKRKLSHTKFPWLLGQ